MSGSQSNKFAAYVAIGKILALLVQFAMPVFLTHYLSESNYGLYSQFYLILTFFGGILCFGLQTNLYYFFPKFNQGERAVLVWNNLIIMTIMGGIGCLIFTVPVLRDLIIGHTELNNYWLILAIAILLFIPTNIIGTLSVVNKDKMLATFYPPIDIVVKLLIIIPVTLVYDNMFAIFCGVLAIQFFQCLFTFIYSSAKFSFPKWKTFLDSSILREQLVYALPFGGAVIINSICQRLDKVISVNFMTTSEYAIYSIAFFGIPGIMQIYDSLTQVNVTNMATAHAKGNMKEVLELYKEFVKQTLSFSIPLILIVSLFAPILIETAFSAKYVASVPYFRVFLLTFIVGMLGCGTILRAIGKTKLSFKAFLVTGIVYIPVCYLLVKNYGINGAIVSSVIGNCMPKILQIVCEIKSMKTSVRDYFPWKSIIVIFSVSLGFLLPVSLLSYFIELSIVPTCFIIVAYLATVYCVEIYFNQFVVEKSYVIKLKDKILSRLSFL